MSTYYNPNLPQDRDAWTKLSAADRIRVAKNYHDSVRIKASKQHAFLHVMIEDQIASGFKPVIRALERLQSEGLGRHDAIHAIADAFTAYYKRLPPSPTPEEQSNGQLRLNADLDALTVREKEA